MSYADKHIVETYSMLFDGLSSLSKIELIEKLTKSLKKEKTIKKDTFFESFGLFSDEKSAEEIIADLKLKSKKMKKILIFISLLSILSCNVKKPLPESFTHNIPELNTTNKTEIGITLVTKESGYKYDAIKILKTLKVKSFLESYELKEGDVFIHDSYTKKFNLYGNTNANCRIAIPTIGENIGKALPYYNNNSGSIVFYNIKDKIEFEKTFVPVIEQKEYFKQEFIYNGRVGTALKFIYREYVDELARPAFTQDLQYDLNESKIIGFRGLRIEVISATNTIIEYKVLNQFSK